MDPITQGALGAAAAQTASQKSHLGWAAVFGAMSGMAADLDMFIRSTHDPLLALEFHRHFTHSLVFIPLGALLCATIFYWLLARRRSIGFRPLYVWCLLGYATHGVLDACTSYGTQLLWPFSDMRVSWDLISVIDPLFTLPLLLAVWVAIKRASRLPIVLGLFWCACYMGFGLYQHQRAVDSGYAIAAARGHEPLRLHAKPSFANLWVWKIVYDTGDHFYVDAVRPGLSSIQVWPGEQIEKLLLRRDFPWLDKSSQQAQDIERFRWFSDGFIAVEPGNPNRVVDIRYSMVPNRINALWGVELDPQAPSSAHVQFNSSRSNTSQAAARLWQMVLGNAR